MNCIRCNAECKFMFVDMLCDGCRQRDASTDGTEQRGRYFLGMPIKIVESGVQQQPWLMRPINMIEELLRIVSNGGRPAIEAAKMLAGMQEWIPVSERLPELNVKVLVTAVGGAAIEIGWREHNSEYIDPPTDWTLGDELDQGKFPTWITHWMPLPHGVEA